MGREGIGEDIQSVEPNLWVVNMNPRAALHEKALMVLRFEAIYRAVMENRLVRYFLQAVPALSEYSMLGKAWYHTTEVEEGRFKYDTVVFDGPAMGHMLTMLRIPQVIIETAHDGPLVEDAREIRGLLRDPLRACLWIVTLAEEMPVSEAQELYADARRELQIRVDRLVLNALYPDDLHRELRLEEVVEALSHREISPVLRPLVSSASALRSRRRMHEHYRELVEEMLPVPRIELPFLFTEELLRPHLELLSREIDRALES